jgi:catechol 2,3-dioxygenase-like lactoylglutathione lyase family enzyme
MPRVSRLGHVAIYADDVPRMTEFYRELFDLTISARDESGRIAFLGLEPHKNHHDLAIVSKRSATHVCFYVDSLTEFREFYAGLRSRNIKVLTCQVVVFGVRMDFHDPEGNLAEVLWMHGKLGRWPFFKEVDLETMTDEDILRIVDEMPLEYEVEVEK